MDTLTRTVEALRVSATAAAQHHQKRKPARMAAARAWEQRRVAYVAAVSVLGNGCTAHARQVGPRCEALANAAHHRVLAYAALLRGEAREAAKHRRQSHKARATAPELTPAVWRR